MQGLYIVFLSKMSNSKILKQLLKKAKEIEKEEGVVIVMVNVSEQKLVVVRWVSGG
jgi:hypothetical protein